MCFQDFFIRKSEFKSVISFLGKSKKRLRVVTELKRNRKYPQKNKRRKINLY